MNFSFFLIIGLFWMNIDSLLHLNGTTLSTNHEISIRGMRIRETILRSELLGSMLNQTMMELNHEISQCQWRLSGLNETVLEQKEIIQEVKERLDKLRMECFGKNQFYLDQCSGHGECVDVDQCDCVDGWTGDECEFAVCFGKNATSDQCSGHGNCVEEDQCECVDGWSGDECNVLLTCFGKDSMDESVCSGHGECVDADDCECDDEWSGGECQDERFTWNEISSDPRPSARRQHSLVEYQDHLWVFGGSGDEMKNDLWQFSISNHSWSEVNTVNTPDFRWLFSSVVYQDAMWIFGGSNNTEGNSFLNDLWAFNFSTLSWNEIITADSRPDPRSSHSAVVYQDAMWVFCGQSGGSLNDFWKFQFVDSWITAHSHPGGRFGHFAVVHQDSMWIFGGRNGNNNLHDTWKFNFTISSWESVTVTGGTPPDIYFSTAVVYQDAVWIFGGSDNAAVKHDQLSKVLFANPSWELIETDDVPIARFGHKAAVHDGKMWIFGGITSTSLHDLWQFVF